jgi:uncharacterized membrane protein YkoI
MKINKYLAIAVLLFGLLLGGLAAGVLLSQRPVDVNAAPPAQQEPTDDANEAEDVDEAGDVEDDDGSEAGESVSPNQAGITADEAITAAETYAGVKAISVELENENGQIVYEVEMENRQEVIIDAADGTVLGIEKE